MNELISKSINRHKSIMIWGVTISVLLIILGSYFDNHYAIINKEYFAGNTFMIIGIAVSGLILLDCAFKFLNKVLCDLFQDSERKQPDSEKINSD